eukprot:scaffold42072_cov57-Phaeocystis_antarctica.AAC.3
MQLAGVRAKVREVLQGQRLAMSGGGGSAGGAVAGVEAFILADNLFLTVGCVRPGIACWSSSSIRMHHALSSRPAKAGWCWHHSITRCLRLPRPSFHTLAGAYGWIVENSRV